MRHKAQKKAAGVGFDWPDVDGALPEDLRGGRRGHPGPRARRPGRHGRRARRPAVLGRQCRPPPAGGSRGRAPRWPSPSSAPVSRASNDSPPNAGIDLAASDLAVLDQLWDEVKASERGRRFEWRPHRADSSARVPARHDRGRQCQASSSSHCAGSRDRSGRAGSSRSTPTSAEQREAGLRDGERNGLDPVVGTAAVDHENRPAAKSTAIHVRKIRPRPPSAATVRPRIICPITNPMTVSTTPIVSTAAPNGPVRVVLAATTAAHRGMRTRRPTGSGARIDRR